MNVGQKKNKFIVNVIQSHFVLISNNNNNDIKLVGKARIKANKRFFNSIAVANKCVKIFTFRENYLCVLIDIIENCKKKISIRSTAYARLAIKYLFNRS